MSTNRKAGKVAVGMFLILSVVVFGSILFVGFSSVNTETVVADTSAEGFRIGEYLQALEGDPDWKLKAIEPVDVPEYVKGIRRRNIFYR